MNGIQRVRNGLLWRADVCRDACLSMMEKAKGAIFGPYWCPVCGAKVEKFNPLPAYYSLMYNKYGRAYPREYSETCNFSGYSCPRCDASDRARLYALYLRKWLLSRAGSHEAKLLDFAPNASLTRFILDLIKLNGLNIQYVTADLMKAGVDVKADICDMPIFADASVDFFCCSHVLEHVRDDRKALAELCRILKPDGQGILMVPINLKVEKVDEDPDIVDVGERWRRFGQYDHVRIYSRAGFLVRIRNAGFIVHEYGAAHFGRRVFWRNGIKQRSVLYIVEKAKPEVWL